MTVEPQSYQIDRMKRAELASKDLMIDMLLSLKVLVPDPRLQAIADAWNALNAVTDIYGPEADMLGDLLDALTEENN